MHPKPIAPVSTDIDRSVESLLRPHLLKDYLGQEPVKASLSIMLEAARERKEPADHVLLYGPPGLGKTTLGAIIAHEMGGRLHLTSGPAIEHTGDLASLLTSLQPGDILFIDEIHRLPRVVEERLYTAMEDFALDIILGKGPSAKSVRLSLAAFTLVGATTRVGMLPPPLRDRFGSVFRLEYYTPDILSHILTRSAPLLRCEADRNALLEIATRSRGTPRIANRLLKRVRDYAQVKFDGKVTVDRVMQALSELDVDTKGLERADISYLDTIINIFHGGPVGIETLAASMNEQAATIEDMYEPYLLQIGFITRTPRGRIATSLAYEHLKAKK